MRVVLPTKGDAIAIYREEAMIRDGHSMGIAGQVLKHVLRSAKGSLGITTQSSRNRVRKKAANAFSLANGWHGPKKTSCFLSKARRNPATNLPRKTRLSTLTGKKKRGAERIHCEWSGDSPPPGTTQWTCGCRCRVCPQVCRMLRKPISAPRRAGSAATSSRVAALVSNKSPNRYLLFCQINGTSACGTLKTR